MRSNVHEISRIFNFNLLLYASFWRSLFTLSTLDNFLYNFWIIWIISLYPLDNLFSRSKRKTFRRLLQYYGLLLVIQKLRFSFIVASLTHSFVFDIVYDLANEIESLYLGNGIVVRNRLVEWGNRFTKLLRDNYENIIINRRE